MAGTIRTLDPAMQKDVHEKIRRTVINIAESAGATAEVSIETKTEVTYNTPELVNKNGRFAGKGGREGKRGRE